MKFKQNLIIKTILSMILFNCLILLCGCSSGSSNNGNQNDNVLIITDIHFDPFNSCGTTIDATSQNCVFNLINESNPQNWSFQPSLPNAFGDETNYAFFESGLANLKNIISSQNITKIFVTGDLLSHHFPTQFADYVLNGTQSQQTALAINTMNYVLYKITQAVPNSKIYYVFGNNDTDQSDYSYPTADFMQKITPVLAPYMADPESFSMTFSDGGYSIMPLNNNTDVIGLNFNPLTVENSANQQDLAVAESQLTWLKKQLRVAKLNNKHIVILQHEPYGINVFNILESYTPTSNLQTALQDQYLELYSQYRDIINNYYYGHYHMEDIQVASDIFSFSTLGFSVDFYNNPGFKVLQLNQNGQLQNFTTYYSNYNLNQELNWQILYQLNSAYQITPSNYVSYFQNQLQVESGGSWLTYVNNYSGNNPSAPLNQMPIIAPSSWIYYYCGINFSDINNYNLCLNQ